MDNYPPKPHPRPEYTIPDLPEDHESPMLHDIQDQMESIIKDIDLNYSRLSYRNDQIPDKLKQISLLLKGASKELDELAHSNQVIEKPLTASSKIFKYD